MVEYNNEYKPNSHVQAHAPLLAVGWGSTSPSSCWEGLEWRAVEALSSIILQAAGVVVERRRLPRHTNGGILNCPWYSCWLEYCRQNAMLLPGPAMPCLCISHATPPLRSQTLFHMSKRPVVVQVSHLSTVKAMLLTHVCGRICSCCRFVVRLLLGCTCQREG